VSDIDTQAIEALREAGLVSVDTETTSVAPVEADLVGMSFAVRERAGWYLPIREETLFGGETLDADLTGYRRLARFGRAPLPGGALAVKKPWRMALGYRLGAEGVGAGERAGGGSAGGGRLVFRISSPAAHGRRRRERATAESAAHV
jgi:hypothetical protein